MWVSGCVAVCVCVRVCVCVCVLLFSVHTRLVVCHGRLSTVTFFLFFSFFKAEQGTVDLPSGSSCPVCALSFVTTAACQEHWIIKHASEAVSSMIELRKAGQVQSDESPAEDLLDDAPPTDTRSLPPLTAPTLDFHREELVFDKNAPLDEEQIALAASMGITLSQTTPEDGATVRGEGAGQGAGAGQSAKGGAGTRARPASPQLDDDESQIFPSVNEPKQNLRKR